MFCSKCGSEMNGDVCPKCGNQVEKNKVKNFIIRFTQPVYDFFEGPKYPYWVFVCLIWAQIVFYSLIPVGLIAYVFEYAPVATIILFLESTAAAFVVDRYLYLRIKKISVCGQELKDFPTVGMAGNFIQTSVFASLMWFVLAGVFTSIIIIINVDGEFGLSVLLGGLIYSAVFGVVARFLPEFLLGMAYSMQSLKNMSFKK